MGMTEAEIQEIENRLSAASPWKPYDGLATQEWRDNKENNAELCQHAFVDIQALLDERKRLVEKIRQMEEAVVFFESALKRVGEL